jgi:hypothetical protein
MSARLSVSGVTKTHKTDEWYSPMPLVKLMFDLLEVKEPSTIMMPFDTEASNFVKHAHTLSCNLWYGITNWLDSNYQYDYLITNPPFSIKDKVIEKCLESGKPSALVLPIDALGGKRRHELYKKYNYPTVYIPSRRINYISEDGKETKSNHFHSIIMILNDPKGTRTIWE